MKIAYVLGIALGGLVQAKAVAFYARKKGEQNIHRDLIDSPRDMRRNLDTPVPNN